MRFRDFMAFVGMWLSIVFLLIFVESIFQLSKFSFLSGFTPWALTKVLFNSTFLLSLPGIAIIGSFALLTLIFKNTQLQPLNSAITKILLFSLSFALIFVGFLHLVTWMHTVYKVNLYEMPLATRQFVWVLLLLISYLIYHFRSYSIHSYFSKQYRYVIYALSLCTFVGLTSIVFEYPKYAPATQISQIKKGRGLPNIILFSSDGLSAEHMSVYGYERDTTPNLHELAESSTVFYRAYSNGLTSKGSVASILTGKSPATTKVLQQCNILQGVDSFQHLPGILKSLGYYNIDTGVVDQTVPTSLNLRNGFNEINGRQISFFLSQLSTSQFLLKVFNVEAYFFYGIVDRFLDISGTYIIPKLSDLQMISVVKRAIREVDAPIFAHLHLLETHPHSRTRRYDPLVRKFSKGKQQSPPLDINFYDDAMLTMDYYLGELIQALKDTNKFDNTILVVFTDHGMELDDVNRIEHIHIISTLPLIVKSLDKNRAESCPYPVQYLDIAPSILKWLNVPIPEWMEGKPFLVDFNNRKPKTFNERPIYSFCVSAKRKVPAHHGIVSANMFKGDYLLNFHLYPPDINLYDVTKDLYAFTPVHDDKLSQEYLRLLLSFLSEKGVKLQKIVTKPREVTQDYRGFKIIPDKDHRLYFGLRHPLTKKILGKVYVRDTRRLYIKDNSKKVKSCIRQYWARLERKTKRVKTAKVRIDEPFQLGKGYSGFNIIKYNGMLYGVNQAEGSMDIRDIQTKAQLPWVSDESITEVKAKIDELVRSSKLSKLNKGVNSQPVLLEEDYSGFNIVIYNGTLYGVNQAEGPMDIRDIRTKAKLPWVSDESITEVKAKIDELVRSSKLSKLNRGGND